MNRILTGAGAEFRIALRNRWVVIAVGMMAVFAAVLSAAGSAPTGELGADRLSVTVASLTSLAVYLVPLVALLMSFDAVAGEVERGTLSLVLTYPVSRLEILLGKFVAHLGILALALAVGYAIAAGAALYSDPRSASGLPALWRLLWTSELLGATFVAIGYALSAWARRPGAAAGLVIGLWLVVIVLYDLGLLAAVVADSWRHLYHAGFPVDADWQPCRCVPALQPRRLRGDRRRRRDRRGRQHHSRHSRAGLDRGVAAAGAGAGHAGLSQGDAMIRRALFALSLLALGACRDDIAALPEPVEMTAEAVGHYCQMNLLEHPGPKAQVHLSGLPNPLFFSQVRDAIAYQRMPEQSHAITVIYVSDMGGGADWANPGASNWIRADTAIYVVGAAIAGGMGAPELVPFSTRAEAEAFAPDHGGAVMCARCDPRCLVLAPVEIDGTFPAPMTTPISKSACAPCQPNWRADHAFDPTPFSGDFRRSCGGRPGPCHANPSMARRGAGGRCLDHPGA